MLIFMKIKANDVTVLRSEIQKHQKNQQNF